MNWWKSGVNWLWATWVEDTQVVYLAEYRERGELPGQYWAVIKKVTGAADKRGHVIGLTEKLDKAKAMAEADAREPL